MNPVVLVVREFLLVIPHPVRHYRSRASRIKSTLNNEWHRGLSRVQ